MTKTVEKQRVIHATPQRTFQALTEKAELERWFVQKAEGTMRPGETMRFEWAPDMVEQGQILEVEPSHRLSYTWKAFSPSPVTITFALSAENGGTHLASLVASGSRSHFVTRVLKLAHVLPDAGRDKHDTGDLFLEARVYARRSHS